MSKKLERLKASLEKKNQIFDEKLQIHFDEVAKTNGQPLNDKRNGAATINRWERQNNALHSIDESIERTKEAIEREENAERVIAYVNEVIPAEILKLVDSGELIQWRKHPTTFFVSGVEMARIVWDEKRKVVAHRYANELTDPEQRKKFVRIYNALNAALNH